MFDHNALMAFCVLADHLNFTRAAEALHISQPALHKKVKKLAGEIGDPLYTRKGRHLVLTRGGELLAAHGRAMMMQGEDVLARIRGDEERGHVTLAAGAGSMLYLLGPSISRARQGPFSLRLLPRKAPAALRELLAARAQVAVGAFEVRHDDVTYHAWRTFSQMVVMPETHRLAARTRITPTDLDGERLIIAPPGMRHRTSTARTLAKWEVSWEVGVEATGWELMVQLVEYGAGVCIINEFVPLPKGLIGVPIEGFEKLEYEIATRTEDAYAGTRWLLEILRDGTMR